MSASSPRQERAARRTTPDGRGAMVLAVVGGLWGLALYGYLTPVPYGPWREYVLLALVSLLALALPLLLRAKPRAGGVAAAVLALAGFCVFLPGRSGGAGLAAFWLPGAICLGIAGAKVLRGRLPAAERGGRPTGVGVWPASLAALGGCVALLAAFLTDLAITFAGEGNPWYSTEERAYIGVWVAVGLLGFCAALFLALRPWLGVWLALVAVAVSLANVALFHPGAAEIHFSFWGIAASPLLLAAALGARRALARRAQRLRRAEGPE